MVDPKSFISPEVEELLAEAAADPRSMLMCSPRATELREPFDLEAGVSARAAGLSPPERRILEVYREETAELLRQWIGLALVDPARGKGYLRRSDPSGEPAQDVGLASLRARAATLLRYSVHPRMPEVTASVESLSKSEQLGLGDSAVLAKLLLKIRPSDSAGILLALSHGSAGSTGPAKQILKSVLRRSVSRGVSAYALHNWAWLTKIEGHPAEAVRGYEAALEAAPNWAYSMTALLFCLVEQGNDRAARRTAARVDALGPSAEGIARTQGADIRKEIGALAWVPSSAARSLATRMRNEVGASSRRILDVFG